MRRVNRVRQVASTDHKGPNNNSKDAVGFESFDHAPSSAQSFDNLSFASANDDENETDSGNLFNSHTPSSRDSLTTALVDVEADEQDNVEQLRKTTKTDARQQRPHLTKILTLPSGSDKSSAIAKQ